MERLIVQSEHPATEFLPAFSPSSTQPDPVLDDLAEALRAFTTLPPTSEAQVLARSILRRVQQIQAAERLGTITDKITQEFRLDREALSSRKRDQRTAFARQVAFWMCRKSGASFTSIAEHLKHHHASVIHGVRLIDARVCRDPAFRHFIGQLGDRIGVAV